MSDLDKKQRPVAVVKAAPSIQPTLQQTSVLLTGLSEFQKNCNFQTLPLLTQTVYLVLEYQEKLAQHEKESQSQAANFSPEEPKK